MRFNLTTTVMPGLLLTVSISTSAMDLEQGILPTLLQDMPPTSSTLLHDTELSTMRAQGFQLPEFDIGVILWDEVDNGSSPKPHQVGNDGVISITVEIR